MNDQQKRLSADFTNGDITRQLVYFSAPLFLSNLLQTVYNMVDMIIVGRVYGKVGLSAVSVGGDICNFLTFFAMGFSNAGQVIISHYLGAGQREKVSAFVRTMFTFLLSAALALSVVCLLLRDPILRWMNTPAESFMETMRYATVCMVGLLFIYGYNIVGAVLRGLGDAKHPFVFISIAAVLNILLDALFVLVFHMGAMGAALATVISQAVSFLVSMCFLLKNQELLELELKAERFFYIDRAFLSALVKLGLPMAIKNASIQFSKIFVNSWINSYGVVVSAVAGIAGKFNSISALFSNSINAAASSMIGQNIGAEKSDRVSQIVRTAFFAAISIAACMSVCIVLFPMQIFGMFTNDQEVILLAMEYIPIAVLSFAGAAGRAPMNALINGSGNYKINFVTAILDGIVFRIGLAFLFGLGIHMRYIGFWLGDAAAGFTPVVIGMLYYFTGKWKKSRL